MHPGLGKGQFAIGPLLDHFKKSEWPKVTLFLVRYNDCRQNNSMSKHSLWKCSLHPALQVGRCRLSSAFWLVPVGQHYIGGMDGANCSW